MSEGSPLDTLRHHHRCPTTTRSRPKSRSQHERILEFLKGGLKMGTVGNPSWKIVLTATHRTCISTPKPPSMAFACSSSGWGGQQRFPEVRCACPLCPIP